MVNLTYAPRDDLSDKMINKRHFQLFMKLLRNAGHKVRYLVAGEYGDEKGRAHFHAILFFSHLEPLGERGIVPRYKDDYPSGYSQDDAPFCREIPHKRMIHIREWPHGHMTCDWSASEQSARYVCKYLLADNKNNAWFSLSKKPALGSAWFAKKAERAREYGVLPSSFEYLPPGGNKKRPYLMTGASRRDYLNAITTDLSRRGAMSDWVQKTFDKHERERVKEYLESLPLTIGPDPNSYAGSGLIEQKAILRAGAYWREVKAMDEAFDRCGPDDMVHKTRLGYLTSTELAEGLRNWREYEKNKDDFYERIEAEKGGPEPGSNPDWFWGEYVGLKPGDFCGRQGKPHSGGNPSDRDPSGPEGQPAPAEPGPVPCSGAGGASFGA